MSRRKRRSTEQAVLKKPLIFRDGAFALALSTALRISRTRRLDSAVEMDGGDAPLMPLLRERTGVTCAALEVEPLTEPPVAVAEFLWLPANVGSAGP